MLQFLFHRLDYLLLRPIRLLLGMGILGAVILNGLITNLRIRGTAPVISLGILMAVVIYGAFRYTDYLTFRFMVSSAMDQELVQETGESQPEVADVFVDYVLAQETGHTGLIGYFLYEAKKGISIGRWYSTNKTNLGPFLTWVYWVVELILIACMTVIPVKNKSNEPFCENCNAWYEKERHVGGFNISKNDEALRIINQKNYSRLGGMLEKDVEVPSSEVYTQSCKTCDLSDTWFILRKISFAPNKELRYETLLQQYISRSERMKMLESLQYAIH